MAVHSETGFRDTRLVLQGAPLDKQTFPASNSPAPDDSAHNSESTDPMKAAPAETCPRSRSLHSTTLADWRTFDSILASALIARTRLGITAHGQYILQREPVPSSRCEPPGLTRRPARREQPPPLALSARGLDAQGALAD